MSTHKAGGFSQASKYKGLFQQNPIVSMLVDAIFNGVMESYKLLTDVTQKRTMSTKDTKNHEKWASFIFLKSS